ncbi:MAG TPA: hypothetical protein VGY57_11725 [Vicinamibacterales bacterium]|nr:hypothetical protein [Candidatus Elarobacter sp.]HEV3141182.1 hypothetical protein [Vicinamibacterales bacterium]
MTLRAGSGDRIILFTLVDLLLQIIFLGLFLFAAYRAVQGDMHDRLTQLARKFGVFSVTNYLNSTSKLVAVADLGRIDVVPAGKKATRAFRDTTTLLQDLDRTSLPELARMNKDELKAFASIYAGLSPAERKRFAALVKRPELRAFWTGLAKLTPEDQRTFLGLGDAFLKADPDTRSKIIAAAANVKPLCFARHNAYEITEVSGGYVVRPLLREVLPDVARAVPGQRGMQSIQLGEAEFARLGEATLAAHRDCTVNVKQATTTNNEQQYKTIQRYFGTWWLEPS